MKLSHITEAKSRTPIRDSANAIGDLIQYINDNYNPTDNETKALQTFLQQPTPRKWLQTKWIIDSAIKRASNDPAMVTKAQKWSYLKSLTSPTITASLFDVDQRKVKKTPLQKTAMSKPLRDKLKKSLGPSGYVSTLSGLGNKINNSRVRHFIRDTAKSGPALTKATRQDFPNIKQTSKF